MDPANPRAGVPARRPLPGPWTWAPLLLTLALVTGLEASDSPEASPELTVRNSTPHTVSFQLRRVEAGRPEPDQRLPPGAVARLPAAVYDITFESDGRRLEYRLSPGGAYTFRYDGREHMDLFLGSHGRDDAVDLAPYVATPMVVVEEMLELAQVGPSDVVYDLGCGDGRIVVTAAERHGARGVGIDLDPQRIQEARQFARDAGVESLVELRVEDATTTDFSNATVLTLYLVPESNALLRPIMEKRLAPGARVVSHQYEIPGWQPLRLQTVPIDGEDDHALYFYVMGRHTPPEAGDHTPRP